MAAAPRPRLWADAPANDSTDQSISELHTRIGNEFQATLPRRTIKRRHNDQLVNQTVNQPSNQSMDGECVWHPIRDGADKKVDVYLQAVKALLVEDQSDYDEELALTFLHRCHYDIQLALALINPSMTQVVNQSINQANKASSSPPQSPSAHQITSQTSNPAIKHTSSHPITESLHHSHSQSIIQQIDQSPTSPKSPEIIDETTERTNRTPPHSLSQSIMSPKPVKQSIIQSPSPNLSITQSLMMSPKNKPISHPIPKSPELLDDSNDVCCICEDGGELIICDQCENVYHLGCAMLGECPDGYWQCMKHYCWICNQANKKSRRRSLNQSSKMTDDGDDIDQSINQSTDHNKHLTVCKSCQKAFCDDHVPDSQLANSSNRSINQTNNQYICPECQSKKQAVERIEILKKLQKSFESIIQSNDQSSMQEISRSINQSMRQSVLLQQVISNDQSDHIMSDQSNNQSISQSTNPSLRSAWKDQLTRQEIMEWAKNKK